MLTLLTYVFGLLLVGGLLFLAASFAFGRGEEMAPALPEGTPVELPDDRPAAGADLRALRLSVVLRGYRMDEVDWVLDRLAEQVDSRDREIARLRSVLHVEPVGVAARSDPPPLDNVAGRGAEPALFTRPAGAPVDSALAARAGSGGIPAGELPDPDPAYLPEPTDAAGVPHPAAAEPAAAAGPGGPAGDAAAGPDPAYLADLPARSAATDPAGRPDRSDPARDRPDPAYLDDPAVRPEPAPEPPAGTQP